MVSPVLRRESPHRKKGARLAWQWGQKLPLGGIRPLGSESWEGSH